MKYGPYILLEGADGTGKTVLAKAIMARTGAKYVHCGPPDKPAFEYYMEKLRSVEGPVVVDRLHLGSYAYGVAFRNVPDLTGLEEWLLEGFLWSHGTLLVYCTVPPETVDKNLSRGPDNADAAIYEAPEKRALVRQLYEERMRTTELTHLRYDYTEMMMESVASAAALYMEMFKCPLRGLPETDAIGNMIDPRLVLVGYRPDLFFSHDRFLYMAIKSAGLQLRDFAMFSADQGDGRCLSKFTLDVPVNLVGPKQVDLVALGGMPARELSYLMGAYGYRMVPNPSHIMEFHYKDVAKYGAAIAGGKPWDRDDCDFCGIVSREVKA